MFVEEGVISFGGKKTFLKMKKKTSITITITMINKKIL
jgi:hypothetical protein